MSTLDAQYLLQSFLRERAKKEEWQALAERVSDALATLDAKCHDYEIALQIIVLNAPNNPGADLAVQMLARHNGGTII